MPPRRQREEDEQSSAAKQCGSKREEEKLTYLFFAAKRARDQVRREEIASQPHQTVGSLLRHDSLQGRLPDPLRVFAQPEVKRIDIRAKELLEQVNQSPTKRHAKMTDNLLNKRSLLFNRERKTRGTPFHDRAVTKLLESFNLKPGSKS